MPIHTIKYEPKEKKPYSLVEMGSGEVLGRYSSKKNAFKAISKSKLPKKK